MSRRSLRCIAAVWIGLLIVFSLQPLRLRAIAGGSPLHPAVHVLTFGFAALFPLLLSVTRMQEWTRALGVLCLGIGIEIAQGFIYRHRTEWRDFEADLLGILAAALLIRSVKPGSLYPAATSRSVVMNCGAGIPARSRLSSRLDSLEGESAA